MFRLLHIRNFRLRLERDEALAKSEELESKLERAGTADSHTVLAIREDLHKKEDEKTTLATLNKALKNDISRAQSELR